MYKRILIFLGLAACGFSTISFNSGCAQVGFPTGGDRDSLPPRLVKATPDPGSLNFSGNRITLNFDEYIDVQEIQKNLLISPLQKTNPTVNFNLRTLTIRFRDSLLPNTTYSINFGDAIRDINETNILKNFSFTFSTGPTIDSLSFNGKVLLAENSKVDSTLLVLLYRNADDSAVIKRKPDYITRLDGEGNFTFNYLPETTFKVYALNDGDGGKTYNARSEAFAFSDRDIPVSINTTPVTLYAYVKEKAAPRPGSVLRPAPEKRLRYTNNLSATGQDLLTNLEISFNNKLKKADTQLIRLTDTSFNRINASIRLDSTGKNLITQTAWQPGASYLLILPKEALLDTIGNTIAKNDTIRFKARATAEYGRVVLRFRNLDLAKHPVIQFMEGETIKYAFPVTSTQWTNNLFPPGEYEIRILNDDNQNGIWDPGDYATKKQPEIAISLPQKLSIKADWDNEREIGL